MFMTFFVASVVPSIESFSNFPKFRAYTKTYSITEAVCVAKNEGWKEVHVYIADSTGFKITQM